jgi:hypothetical protein
MQLSRFVSGLTALSVMLLVSVSARADFINGTVWSVPASTASNAPTVGSVPGAGATEWGTFTANGINFSATTSNYTLGGFLSSGSADNITFMNGATGASSMLNTLFEFTGTASFTNGQVFNVAHDDGLNMYVNGGLVLAEPGATSPITSTFTYTGPTGNFSFDFVYVECCGAPAVFQTTLVPNVAIPEPGNISLLGIGLFLIGASAKRLRLSKR